MSAFLLPEILEMNLPKAKLDAQSEMEFFNRLHSMEFENAREAFELRDIEEHEEIWQRMRVLTLRIERAMKGHYQK